MNRKHLPLLLAPLVAMAPAYAADDPLLDDGFAASLGTFFLNTHTMLRVAGSVNNGDNVYLERDLGLGQKDSTRLDLHWRFNENHKIRAMVFDNQRSATRTLSQDITIGDTTYPNGTVVTTNFDVRILELAYEYDFVHRDTWEITATAGLHTLSFDFDIDGAANTPDEATVTGPLPVFGAHGTWKFANNWYLDGQIQFFAIEVGDYGGHLSDYKASATYMVNEHVGIGAGFNWFTMLFESNQPDFEGAMIWSYGGPMLFIQAAF